MGNDCLFLETIRVCDGRFCNLEAHLRRMRETCAEAFRGGNGFPLTDGLRVPADCPPGTVKCRILYDREIRSIEFIPYAARPVRSLQLVDGGDTDYHLKYADRSRLEMLRAMRGECDDVLIVKNGMVTDTSYSNIVFFDGCRYVTPSACLLNGTRRRQLLLAGVVEERPVRVADIPRFQTAFLVNAMIGLADRMCLKCADIRFPVIG